MSGGIRFSLENKIIYEKVKKGKFYKEFFLIENFIKKKNT